MNRLKLDQIPVKARYLRILVAAYVKARAAGFDGFAAALWAMIAEETIP